MARVTKAAIRAGYRHIDTAKSYGTEPLMGPALSELIADGEISRGELFITSKVRGKSCHTLKTPFSFKRYFGPILLSPRLTLSIAFHHFSHLAHSTWLVPSPLPIALDVSTIFSHTFYFTGLVYRSSS